MPGFKLDPKLEKDSFLSDVFDEIQIRTINDSRYIWFILVPAIPQLKEWYDLPPALEAKLSSARQAERFASVNQKSVHQIGKSHSCWAPVIEAPATRPRLRLRNENPPAVQISRADHLHLSGSRCSPSGAANMLMFIQGPPTRPIPCQPPC